jgi:hypothetical protein
MSILAKKKSSKKKKSNMVQFPGSSSMDVVPVVQRVFDEFMEETLEFESFREFEDSEDFRNMAEELHSRMVQEFIQEFRGIGQTTVQKALKRGIPVLNFLIFLFVRVNELVHSQLSEEMLKSLLASRELEYFATMGIFREQMGEITDSLEKMPYPVNSIMADLYRYVMDEYIEPWDEFPFIQTWEDQYWRDSGKTEISVAMINMMMEIKKIGLEIAKQTDVFKETLEKIRPLFASDKDMELFLEGREFNYGFADVPDEEYKALGDRLFDAIQNLADGGDVEEGRIMDMGDDFPIAFLQRMPLKEREWIHKDYIDIVERYAYVRKKGYRLISIDPHVLSEPQVMKKEGDELVQLELSEFESIMADFEGHLASFPGRKKTFSGVEHLNVMDYLSWKDRQWEDDPELVEGLVSSSWNEWVDSSKKKGVTLIEGVPVDKIHSWVGPDEMAEMEDGPLFSTRNERTRIILTCEDWKGLFEGDKDEEKGIKDPYFADPFPFDDQPSRFRLAVVHNSINQSIISQMSINKLINYLSKSYFGGRDIIFEGEREGLAILAENVTEQVEEFGREAGLHLMSLESLGLIDFSDESGEYSWGSLFPNGYILSIDYLKDEIEEEYEDLVAMIKREGKEETGIFPEPFYK